MTLGQCDTPARLHLTESSLREHGLYTTFELTVPLGIDVTGTLLARGPLNKLVTHPSSPIQYKLPVGDDWVDMSALIGGTLTLEWHHEIRCIHCARITKKSFNQGYCYPCFTKLAQCDRCVIKPELCHYHEGTCRDPKWGEKNCLIPHTVYLSNASGLKVGITRGLDATTRWIDQGASQGLAIRVVPNRLSAGTLEVMLKNYVADKTDWRKMLKGRPQSLDLTDESLRLMSELRAALPNTDIPGESRNDAKQVEFEYPVHQYPEKVRAHNLDKTPLLTGKLVGIKGQYLIFEDCVINVRKYGGYLVSVTAG